MIPPFKLMILLLASILLIVLPASSPLSVDIIYVGEGCTPGEQECQENQTVRCACFIDYEYDFETDEVLTKITVCEWEQTGDSCGDALDTGDVPDCTESRRGAEHRFSSGNVKECTCNEDDSGEVEDCYWD